MATCTIAVTDHPFHNTAPEQAAATRLGAELRVGECHTADEVAELVRGADAILTCWAPVTAQVIAGLQGCRIIARYGIGVDNVDLDAASAHGIPVTNVPEYCTDEVSDHALALLLAWTRKIVVADRAVRRGGWGIVTAAPIRRLQGQTLGLVGLGKVARRLAAKAQALGMRVCGADPYMSAEMLAPLGIALLSLQEVLRESDVVSVHAPLTAETRQMIDAAALALMKPSAFLINTARGPLIDDAALAAALAGGGLAGAALDVTPTEPLPPDSPLWGADNLILTPHIAYYSEESVRDLQQQAVDEVERALRGEPLQALVNRDALAQAHTT